VDTLGGRDPCLPSPRLCPAAANLGLGRCAHPHARCHRHALRRLGTPPDPTRVRALFPPASASSAVG